MLSIARETPDQAEVLRLLRLADERAAALYPAESRHGPTVAALLDQGVRFFVARLAGVAIGCGGFARLGGATAELKRLFVEEAARGCGVGRLILQAVEAAARREGITVMLLETGVSSVEARALAKPSDRWYAPDLEGDGEGPAAEWLKATKVVDRGAQTLIRLCLAKATEAAGESEVDWLAAAATLAATDTLELAVIKKMQLDAEKINGLSDHKSRAEKQLLAELNGRLDALTDLANLMKAHLNKL